MKAKIAFYFVFIFGMSSVAVLTFKRPLYFNTLSSLKSVQMFVNVGMSVKFDHFSFFGVQI